MIPVAEVLKRIDDIRRIIDALQTGMRTNTQHDTDNTDGTNQTPTDEKTRHSLRRVP